MLRTKNIWETFLIFQKGTIHNTQYKYKQIFLGFCFQIHYWVFREHAKLKTWTEF